MAERKINGRTFRCEPVPALDGLSLLGRIARLVIAPASDVVASAYADGEEGFTSAVRRAFERLDNPDLALLIRDLAETASVEREPVVIGGNLSDPIDIIEIAVWAAEVNLGPFFHGDRLKAIWGRVTSLMAAK